MNYSFKIYFAVLGKVRQSSWLKSDRLHTLMKRLIFDNLCNFRYYSYSALNPYEYQNVSPNKSLEDYKYFVGLD